MLVEVSSSAEDKEVSDRELSVGVDPGEADEEDALEAKNSIGTRRSRFAAGCGMDVVDMVWIF